MAALTSSAMAAPRACSVAVNAVGRRICTCTSPTVSSMTSIEASAPSVGGSASASKSRATTSGNDIGRSTIARAART